MDRWWRTIFTVWAAGLLFWASIGVGLYAAAVVPPGPVMSGGNPGGDSTPTAPDTTAPSPATPTGTEAATRTPTRTAPATPTPTATPVDRDGDGLSDRREREMGTDPTDRDTDGDRIPDGWEVAGEAPDGTTFPDADPLRKDLYVETYWSLDAHPPNSYDGVVERFARMNVSNPDGSTGITVHLERRGLIDRPLIYDGTGDSATDIFEHTENSPYHHQVVVVEYEDDQTRGVGSRPGYHVLLNEDVGDEEAQFVVVHELLHNVLGVLEAEGRCASDPGHYCDGGYMEPYGTNQGEYLPEPLTDQVNETGFKPRPDG